MTEVTGQKQVGLGRRDRGDWTKTIDLDAVTEVTGQNRSVWDAVTEVIGETSTVEAKNAPATASASASAPAPAPATASASAPAPVCASASASAQPTAARTDVIVAAAATETGIVKLSSSLPEKSSAIAPAAALVVASKSIVGMGRA